MHKIKHATQKDVEKFKKKLGVNIKFYRELKAITQEQLAEMAGIGTSSLGCIEIGLSMPKPETLINLARALEIEVGEFFDTSNVKNIDRNIKLANTKIDKIKSFGEQILKLCEITQEIE